MQIKTIAENIRALYIDIDIDIDIDLDIDIYHLWQLKEANKEFNIYIYIYIYTRFQKGFHIERYIDRYIVLFSCTCAGCAFFNSYCPTCEKPRFNDKFFLRRVLCSNLKRTCRLFF